MTQDTEDVVVLSSVCGAHFHDDCQSCQSAKTSNDDRLQSLSDRIDVLLALVREADEVAWPNAAILVAHSDLQQQVAAKRALYAWRDKARAALHQEGISAK